MIHISQICKLENFSHSCIHQQRSAPSISPLKSLKPSFLGLHLYLNIHLETLSSSTLDPRESWGNLTILGEWEFAPKIPPSETKTLSSSTKCFFQLLVFLVDLPHHFEIMILLTPKLGHNFTSRSPLLPLEIMGGTLTRFSKDLQFLARRKFHIQKHILLILTYPWRQGNLVCQRKDIQVYSLPFG
jgi:hypothetical protein